MPLAQAKAGLNNFGLDGMIKLSRCFVMACMLAIFLCPDIHPCLAQVTRRFGHHRQIRKGSVDDKGVTWLKVPGNASVHKFSFLKQPPGAVAILDYPSGRRGVMAWNSQGDQLASADNDNASFSDIATSDCGGALFLTESLQHGELAGSTLLRVDARTLHVTKRLPIRDWLTANVCVSTRPPHPIVAFTTEIALHIYDLAMTDERHRIACEKVQCVSFSPDATTIAAGTANGSITFLDTATGRQLGDFKVGMGEFYALRWGDSGKIAVITSNQELHVLERRQEWQLAWKRHVNLPIDCAFGPTEGSLTVLSLDGKVSIISLSNPQRMTSLMVSNARGLALSNGGKQWSVTTGRGELSVLPVPLDR